MTGPLLLSNGHVLTMDPALGELPRADVLVADGRIRAIGPDLDAGAATVLDVRGQVVMPGFVDTHRHTWVSALRGANADLSIRQYREVMFRGVLPRYGPAELRHGALLGAAEALDAGVTTIFDWHNATPSAEHADAAIDGLTAAGIRAVFAHGSADNAADVRRLAGRSGLVTVGLAIIGPEWHPFGTAAAQLALGRELGMTVSMHIGIGTTGPQARAVTGLHRAGLLGPDLNLVHCNTIGDDEVRMLVDAGAGVTVTPVSECMLADGPVPYGRFRAAGGAPGLGVDVVTVAGPGMFEQMRALLWLERHAYASAEIAAGRDPETVRPAAGELLPAATIDGARAIGMAGEIGSLTVGKRADIAVLDGLGHLTGDAARPAGVAGAVVSALGVENVRTVLVGGRVVKRDGRLVGTDLAALRAEAVEVARRVRHDSGALSSAG